MNQVNTETHNTSSSVRSGIAFAGAATGIGSLPFNSTGEAIRAVADLSPELPFWPQLPRLSSRESVIAQGLGVLDGLIEPRHDGYGFQVKNGRLDSVLTLLHASDGELRKADAAGFHAFSEAQAEGAFQSATAVKGQIEGPITLAAHLFYRDQAFLSDPSLFAAITAHGSNVVRWQIDRLRSASLPVLVFVDEPALCMNPTSSTAVPEDQRLDAVAGVLEAARADGAVAGLHCCAGSPFERMCQVTPDVISFDAHQRLELFIANRSVRTFLRDGGIVAYGIVPTVRDLYLMDPSLLYVRWLQAAASVADPRELAARSIITATCGLGLLDESSVPASFHLARKVGRFLRALAMGD